MGHWNLIRISSRAGIGFRISNPLLAGILLATLLTSPLLAQTKPATSPTPPPPAPSSPDTAAYQQFVFADRQLQRGEDKLAVDAFDEYLRLYPQDKRRGDGIYYRALLASRAGDNETARRLLADCPPLKLLPASSLPLLRAEVYCDLGKFEPALAVLEKINPDLADPGVKAQLLYLTALAYRELGQPARHALKNFDAAGTVDTPLKARSLLEESRVAVLMDKPADAVADLQKCLAVKDLEIEPVAALKAGDLSYSLNQFPQAVAFYQIVIDAHQTSPQFGPAVIGTLWAQLADKQYEALLKTCQDIRPALSPADGFTADYLAASALQEMGRNDQAITRLEALLALPPTPDQARDKVVYKLALSEYESNHFADMTKTLSGFARTFPQSPLIPDMDYLQALADVKRGDPASGAAQLTAIIAQGDRNPYYARALVRRAELYESTDQAQAAIVDYRKFLIDVPQSKEPADPALTAEGALRLTDLLMRLGQYDEAQKTAATLLAQPNLDPLTEQEALYRQGLALVKEQKLDAALASFQTLLSKYSENRYQAESHFYRGLLLTGLQRADEATPDLLAAAQGDLPDPLKAQALRVASINLREKNDPMAKAVLLQLASIVTIPGLKPDEMIWLARCLRDAHEPTEALKYLTPLLEPTPATTPASQSAIGNRQSDFGEISRAAILPPSAIAEAAFVAGRCQRDAQDLPAAIASFRRVIALNPGFELEARLELARALATANQSPAALKEIRPSHQCRAQRHRQCRHLRVRPAPPRQRSGAQARQRARRPPSRADRGPQALQAVSLALPLPPAFPLAGVELSGIGRH